jgi:Na+/H+ antiporter NhaD/arsenite permease-like protein
LSIFLTNDIALFITVPLTLGLTSIIQNDVKKLIIFQAIAVNTGSALSPIGNPQNLYLWHKWNIGFLSFMWHMAPLVLLLTVILILFIWFSFPGKPLAFHNKTENKKTDFRLFYFSFLLLIAFVMSIEVGHSLAAFAIVIALYLMLYPRLFLKIDWALPLLFIVMFIDFHLLSQIPVVTKFVAQFNIGRPSGNFLSGILYSQIISNVPATIFLSKFSNQWQAIAYGVNVGGNGLVIASLANLIALRFVKRRSIWFDFHKYSLSYLLVTGVLAYLFFFI